MRVECEISSITLEGDYEVEIPSVCATCTRCGHETEAYGESDSSIKRCLVTMREECPKGESNFYIADDED